MAGKTAPGRSIKFFAIGDAGLLVELATTLDLEVNDTVLRLAAAIRARGLPWIRDVVPALGSLALHFDLERAPAAPQAESEALLRDCLKARLPRPEARAQTVEISVCYEGDLAPDLAEVASRTGLGTDEVVRRHVRGAHRVLMIGFVPGQPYIGGLDPALSLPRRATPRTRVEPGSIAIANGQTTVYPFATPGGWSVIGRTPLDVFDVGRDPPSLFSAGAAVKFVAIGRDEFERRRGG